MWAEIEKYLPQFSSAVLTGVDAEGYPDSIRCKPLLDPTAHLVRLRLPANARVQPGPATLLWHSHDEKLWSLKGFAVRGTLEPEGETWIFRPTRFIPGTGVSNLAVAILNAQRTTRRYLKKRGLARPRVPWEKLQALKPPKTNS